MPGEGLDVTLGGADLEREKLQLERDKFEFEKEKFARTRWWQEDSLVNNRLTWLLTSQGLLFAGYGVAAKEPALANATAAIPLAGLAVCVVLAVAIQAAWRAQFVLEEDYKRGKIQLGVHARTTFWGRFPGYALPAIFILAWGWIRSGADVLIALAAFIILLWLLHITTPGRP